MIDQLETRLVQADLSEADRYLYLSALLGLARASGRFELADQVLSGVRTGAPEARLSRLAGLWWADDALFAGRYLEAERRYRELIQLEDRSAPEQQLMVMGSPLRDWLAVQAGQAIALQGRPLEAAKWLEKASLQAFGLVEAMRRRGAQLAGEARDRPLQKRLEKKLPPRFQPRPARVYGVEPPPVRPLEALGLKAPWEPQVGQRAGALSANPLSYLSFVFRGLRRGRPDSPCGEAAAGYYYRTGSHHAVVRSGRDAYAIDFAAPGPDGSPWGSGSFGIQLRAAGEGVVGFSYYGTRTHRSYRSRGPVPDNNSVAILHFAPGLSLLDLVLGPPIRMPARPPGRGKSGAGDSGQSGAQPQTATGKEAGSRRIDLRPFRRRGLDLREAWDYQTWYHHLVGLEDPCPASSISGRAGRKAGNTGSGCIPFPAQVSVGQYVWAGSPLGYEDATGHAMMDHLHFQINVTCRSDSAGCPADYRYRNVGRSVPVVLEGHRLTSGDMGACVVSTNEFELAVDQNGNDLPDVLEPRP